MIDQYSLLSARIVPLSNAARISLASKIAHWAFSEFFQHESNDGTFQDEVEWALEAWDQDPRVGFPLREQFLSAAAQAVSERSVEIVIKMYLLRDISDILTCYNRSAMDWYMNIEYLAKSFLKFDSRKSKDEVYHVVECFIESVEST